MSDEDVGTDNAAPRAGCIEYYPLAFDLRWYCQEVKMKKEKQFLVGSLALAIGLVWTCTCSAGIAVVRIKNRMVPTTSALERQYRQMGDYRDSHLRLPECRGKKLLRLYERTVSVVAELFEKQGSLISKYSSAFDVEDIDELLSLKRKIEINWGKVKSSIRNFEFACKEQCGTPIDEGVDISAGGTGEASQNEDSPGMSLLGQDNTEAVETYETKAYGTEAQGTEAADNDSIEKIRQNDPYFTDQAQGSVIDVLTAILGLTSTPSQSSADASLTDLAAK